MFIRGFPLYGYLMTVSTLICVYFPARCELFRVHQGFPPIWFFNDCLNTYVCQFYRPLGIIPRRVKLFDLLVGTMEVKHQIHRHSEGRSTSHPMFIKGFPLYGFSMTVSTPICSFLISRCELFRVE